jgi:hypothetical protein
VAHGFAVNATEGAAGRLLSRTAVPDGTGATSTQLLSAPEWDDFRHWTVAWEVFISVIPFLLQRA